MAEAKRDFNRGLLIGASISPQKDAGFLIELKSKLPTEATGYLVEARGKSPRSFAQIASVINTIESIGFKLKRLDVVI